MYKVAGDSGRPACQGKGNINLREREVLIIEKGTERNQNGDVTKMLNEISKKKDPTKGNTSNPARWRA